MAAGSDVNINNLGFFPIRLQMHIGGSSQTPIELILVFLEISRGLVCRTLKKLKVQWSDQ